MNLPTLVYRLIKGSALTASEHDENLRKIRDFSNALAALFGVSLNADGTLKAGAVNATTVLANRIVTNPKMDFFFNFYAVATGTNTYSIAFTDDTGFSWAAVPTGGMVFWVKFTNANTLAACTLELVLDGVATGAPKTILKNGGAALSAGDIEAGQVYACVWDGTNILLCGKITIPTTVSSGSARLYYSTAGGGAAQAILAGGPTTVFVNGKTDPNSIVPLLAANEFTLNPGTYNITAIVPLYCETNTAYSFQLQLYDVTNATTIAYQSCRKEGDTEAFTFLITHPILITVATTFRIQILADAGLAHVCTLGQPVTLGGIAEYYTQVNVIKLA